MSRRIVFWIFILIAHLAAVLADTNYQNYGNNFIALGNETCTSTGNWSGGSTVSSGICQVDGDNEYGKYINQLLNPFAVPAYSIDFKMRIDSCSDNNRVLQFCTHNGSDCPNGGGLSFSILDQSGTIKLRDDTNANTDTLEGVGSGTWYLFHVVINGTRIWIYVNGEEKASMPSPAGYQDIQSINFGHRDDTASCAVSWDNFVSYNGTVYDLPEEAVNGPPHILTYNLTSEGGLGCTNWNTNKSNPCITSDTTPTVKVTTNENAYCRIGLADSNYTTLNSSGECLVGGSTSHTCSVPSILPAGTSLLYIGCRDFFSAENLTSTSGNLTVSIPVATETEAEAAIDSGVRRALGSGYTSYSEQLLQSVDDPTGQQAMGFFDRVIAWGSDKIWAFNVLTGSDARTTVFNITPTLYVLEFNSTLPADINESVYGFILATK